jgi:GntR family transcriptional regulator
MATAKQFGRKLPLWYQACESIRAEIHERIAVSDLRLPTESQLAEDHHVSIITVRQALSVLEEEGLISRVRRRGTMINPDAVRSKDLRVLGSHSAVLNQQFAEGPKLLEKSLVSTPEELKAVFKGVDKLTFMRRLRHVNGEPVNYCINHILPEFGQKITEEDLVKWPMPRILRDICNVRIARVDYVVKAVAATAVLAKQLKVETRSPLLFFTSTVFDENEHVIEVGHIYYRPESFSFDVSVDMN